jgi:hypothetical protein
VAGDQNDPLAILQGCLEILRPGERDPGSQKLQQPGEVGITDEQLFVVMVEDPFEGGFDFFVQDGGRDLSAKNMFYGISNQGFFSPAQEIVEPAQNRNIASGD